MLLTVGAVNTGNYFIQLGMCMRQQLLGKWREAKKNLIFHTAIDKINILGVTNNIAPSLTNDINR